MHSPPETTRTLTLRLPASLAETARRLAARHGVSVNELFRLALRRMAEEERFAMLRESYDALGTDADADVEPYVAAQREIARRG